ncbi:lysylphosphatidylglycerol synthase domain-containing protein, partial [Verrucomicrobiota bacterium]
EVARVWGLGLSRDEAVSAGTMVLVDRGTDLLGMLVLIAPSVFYFFGLVPFLLVGAGLVVGVALFLWFIGSGGTDWLMKRCPFKFVATVLDAVKTVRPVALLGYALFGIVVTLCGVAQVYLLLNASTAVPFSACLIGLPIVFTNSILPVSVGGVGVRETLMTLVFGRLGVPSEVAVSAIFVYFVQTILTPGVIGLCFAAVVRSDAMRQKRPVSADAA